MLSGFLRYCFAAAGAGLAAAAVSLAVGYGLMRLYPASSLLALALKMGVWTLLTLAPMMLATLPGQVRQSLVRRLRPGRANTAGS